MSRLTEPKQELLTFTLVDSIGIEDIIYGESAVRSAMGNAGGVLLYVLNGNEVIRYETSLFRKILTNNATSDYTKGATPVYFR